MKRERENVRDSGEIMEIVKIDRDLVVGRIGPDEDSPP